jgi:hypothetical protein
VASKVKFVTQGQRSGVYITDFRELNRELRIIQPSLVRQLQSDFKRIAKPMQADVKNKIPVNPGEVTSGIHKKKPQRTTSGFYPRVVPGRLTWGANTQNNNIPVNSVKIQSISATKARRAMRKNPKNEASIARLRIDNAAVVMADMAGKSKKYINKRPITRQYPYSRSRSGQRQHRINNQGIFMIRALDNKAGHGASRFVWKAAEKSMPKVRAETRMVLEKAYARINRKLSS